jgi:hypothetical protein
MSAKVVRTTVATWFTEDGDEGMGVAHDLSDSGLDVDDPVVILPSADYDRMVEREREARELLEVAADIAADHHDSWRCEYPDRYGKCEGEAACPTQRTAAAIRAFLAETKETSDGK